MARLLLSLAGLLLILHVATAHEWEFGINTTGSQQIFADAGVLNLWDKVKTVQIKVPNCMELVYVNVKVHNLVATPDTSFSWNENVVTISYSILQSSLSTYEVKAKAIPMQYCN